MTVQVGQAAPDFELQGSNGNSLRLQDLKGKYVILYFYPKDMTPGCTTEACDFRDLYTDFGDLNAVILGISPDPLDKHKKFIDKYNIPFELLSDEDHAVAEMYEVWKLKKNYGKEYMGIERSTFLIDKEGILIQQWRKVRVKGHVDDALQFLKEHEADQQEG